MDDRPFTLRILRDTVEAGEQLHFHGEKTGKMFGIGVPDDISMEELIQEVVFECFPNEEEAVLVYAADFCPLCKVKDPGLVIEALASWEADESGKPRSKKPAAKKTKPAKQ